MSRLEIEDCFDLLCDALEEGCGCEELGSAHCIMLAEYVALCELREMAMRPVANQEADTGKVEDSDA
jgi:hypothetical protein